MKLLIVEDDIGLHKQYKWSLSDYTLLYATDRPTAIEQLEMHRPELVLLDLGLPPDEDNASEGLALLESIMSSNANAKVVVLTGSEQRDHAIEAVRLGAFDFQQKGIPLEELALSLDRAKRYHELESENQRFKEQHCGDTTIIGSSTSMQKATRTLLRIAPMPISTLLSGESGTGKELFAQNIHTLSKRKGQFVAINCASIPKDLLESELFGHEKGAFTGAHKRKIGKIEQADGGTLFLDEIGDMPMDLQSKLLRFLQERQVERVGSTNAFPVDVRVICATHRDLDSMKAAGDFREDLYYRLAEFVLKIPSLREREDDVLMLAEYYLKVYRQELPLQNRKAGCQLSPSAQAAILEYQWPGNVRELQNRIKSAVVICENELISEDELNLPMATGVSNQRLVYDTEDDSNDGADVPPLKDVRRRAESTALQQAYRAAQGNITEAANRLGISRPAFYKIAEKHGLSLDKSQL